MLQPSLTTWCMHSSSTCSSAPSRSSDARNSGPAARSNGREASSLARRSTSASPIPARSSTGSAKPVNGRITCTGAPSASLKTVRSASWRRTTSPSARSSAPVSSAPPSRSAE